MCARGAGRDRVSQCRRQLSGRSSISAMQMPRPGKPPAAGCIWAMSGHRDADGWFYFDYRMGGGIRHNGDFVNTAFVEKAAGRVSRGGRCVCLRGRCRLGCARRKGRGCGGGRAPGQHIDVAALYAHCRATLESNFVPTYIQVMDEIPKTASEKPQERFCLEFFRAHPEAVFSEDRNQAQLRRQS